MRAGPPTRAPHHLLRQAVATGHRLWNAAEQTALVQMERDAIGCAAPHRVALLRAAPTRPDACDGGRFQGVMISRPAVWLATLLLTAPAILRAERLPIKTYTTAEGLVHNDVHRIVRDSRGFLWFCTAGGLSQFDGYTFRNFGTEHGLPHSSVNDFSKRAEASTGSPQTAGSFVSIRKAGRIATCLRTRAARRSGRCSPSSCRATRTRAPRR